MSGVFVVGTDTGVGKSLVAAALLHRLGEQHARVVGMKPVAAGATCDEAGTWANEDVLALQAASTIDAPAALRNPCLLKAAVSPHIAARRDGVVIDVGHIVSCAAALRSQADVVVVEGAGGFRVPLGDSLDGADLAVALRLPLVLVVGLKLGCLNHALLTIESIAARGLTLAGWVVNRIDPHMPEQEANIELLERRIAAPCLGDIPHRLPPDARQAASRLRLPSGFPA
ncbi:MAG TPA: dethiobiotin synthase [Albitalea sp.]